MSNIETLNDLVKHAESNISEVLSQLNIDNSYDLDDIKHEIESLLDLNGYNAPEIIYYHEAWSIVAGSEFNSFDPEIDFSECKNSLDCISLEANEIINEAYHSIIGDCIEETASRIVELIEVIQEISDRDDLTLTFSNSSLFGWMPHNRENSEGVCIYDDKPGFYNAEKVEGELYAVEASVNGAYVSACWNPDEE